MRSAIDENIWNTFSATIEEWNIRNTDCSHFEILEKKQAKNLLIKMALSTDVDPIDGQFNSHFLVEIIRHLYLQEQVENKTVHPAISSLWAIWCLLGNRYNFELSYPTIYKLLNIGMQIDGSPRMPNNENLQYMVSSAKRLLRITTGLSVKNGTFRLSDNFRKTIFQCLDENMKQIGGLEFIAHCKELIWMGQRYNPDLDRYMICRKDPLGERIKPINFLLHLAARHLHEPIKKRRAYPVQLHQEIIDIASDFLEVCDLQDVNGIEYAMMPPEKVTYYLLDDLFLHKMCLPVQYSAKFILSALDYLIRPWFHEAKRKYKYRDYYNFVSFILEHDWNNDRKPIKSIEDFYHATKIARYKLPELLDDVSQSADKVNQLYTDFDAPTNFFDYPLVYIPNRGYLCLDWHLSGYGFLTCIHKIIKTHDRDLDSNQGYKLEEWLQQEMKKKHYSIKFGHYPAAGNLKESDCDVVIDAGKLYFLELKKQAIMRDFDEVDDVGAWNALGSGMVRAQKQCFAHELYLRTNHAIRFDNGSCIYENKQKLPSVKVSICFGEHAYLASKVYTIALMRMVLLGGEINTVDSTRQDEVEPLNEYSDDIRDIVHQQNSLVGHKSDIQELLRNSVFCCLQQILAAIWTTSGEAEFLEILDEWQYRIDGMVDPYMILFTKLHMLHHPQDGELSKAMMDFTKNRSTIGFIVS